LHDRFLVSDEGAIFRCRHCFSLCEPLEVKNPPKRV
jgi:hypothetical protein